MNRKGFAEVAILYVAIAVLGLLFIPNPVSKVAGIGIQPNKITQSTVEKVDLIKNADGTVIGTKTTTSVDDKDIQQHVTFWQWLTSLPILVLILMGVGVVCPPVALFLHNVNQGIVDDINSLKSDSKKIVASVEAGLNTITDPAAKQNFLDAMSKVQDSTTKSLVADLKRL